MEGSFGYQRKPQLSCYPDSCSVTHNPRNIGERRKAHYIDIGDGLLERRELSPPNKHCSSFGKIPQLAIQILNELNGI